MAADGGMAAAKMASKSSETSKAAAKTSAK
jgi:hypothetical protein